MDTVYQKTSELILQIAKDQSLPIREVRAENSIVEDLGFKSLDIATLASMLDLEFNVEPFTSNMAAITEIHTVEDLCNVYRQCMGQSTGNEPRYEIASRADERLRAMKKRKGKTQSDEKSV
ncbi:MAG: hypothetical protein GY749_27520 [Desulfobacteraceae bacterium]|nr:hypothetical protein [Desulfobacteraceae bacterium]